LSNYEQRMDGEWVHWSRKGHLVACCDCGLVHLMRPRVRAGRVEVQATRMPRNTAARRVRIRKRFKLSDLLDFQKSKR
jgi:hypothetical protein